MVRNSSSSFISRPPSGVLMRESCVQVPERNQLSSKCNVTLAIVTMRVCNQIDPPVVMNGRDLTVAPIGFAQIVCGDLPALHAHLSALRYFGVPGKPGHRTLFYPLIAAVTGPILTFAPPPFFGAYRRNWPLPRLMARDPSPTLKIVFSPRRVIV
jgi:hypothetical protein